MLKIPQAVQILPLSLFAFLAVSSPSQAQSYETFSVKANNNEDKALNTNWNFRKIDGKPRMSIWKRNDSDPDQQFERVPLNNGSFRLKHRRTGLCLNAHYLANGREINLWDCNDSDLDQHFDLLALSDGSNLIRRRDTNFCVDSPSRQDGGIVHLLTCDANNANQKWRSSNTPQTIPNNGNVIVRPSVINRTFGRGAEFVTSNRYKFIFQQDGNLVLYTPQGKAIWATGTNGTAANMLAVQTDGNVVLYNNGRPVWATDTSGNLGAYLAIQTDGNIVVYTSSNTPVFNTSTVGGTTRTFTASADWLRKNTQITGLMATPTIMSQLTSGQLNGRKFDVDGHYGAQCWDLVAYATGINSSSRYWLTSNWRRGENVIANRNIAKGTSIATFKGTNSTYLGHTAVFEGYDTVNGAFGFWAWSQNFPEGSGVRRHFISISGSSSWNNNANDYFVIKV
jgi:hypothetical protein